ncbi:zinc-binding dehydrogenase [Phycicoccus endophyticus]|uniref:Zinc-binding dehydrogenase n=1 Tax=Phycicoccus endophyticus TaxID=1690220 RepID=A0A7G9R2A2_9MICO|nr:zinc-binding dehydrogenase [Phycicoccus endophyticus]NHI19607.1 zinc-binding dehydrogenase [Phycicoccus endophyticus]QNN49727.1 zinc-binding dehydrogenase [Phycicoccus endophyticus]GGL34539.1 alcohol dehydrogenase [Phycicoccus endophyticus]
MVTTTWVRATSQGLRLETGVLPALRPGEARIRSVYVGICGSDLHAVAGEHPFVPLPYRPGHEVVAVVEALAGEDGEVQELLSADAAWGTGPDHVRVGDRVVVEPDLYCGACKQCSSGRTNLCERLDFYGCGGDQGGMAERSVIRADRLHRVPDEMTDLEAALVEPLATPVHAVRLAAGARTGESPSLVGRTVVVIGAGTIGLLVVAAARWAGARRIVVTDVLEAKRERALRIGADAAVDATAEDCVERVRAQLGESADVVFDCVSVQQTMDQAVRMALKGGTVVVVGVPVSPVTVDLPTIQDQQVRVQGTITYLAEDYATAFRIIGDGGARPDDLVTLTVPLTQVDRAFSAARSGEHVKVLVHP